MFLLLQKNNLFKLEEKKINEQNIIFCLIRGRYKFNRHLLTYNLNLKIKNNNDKKNI